MKNKILLAGVAVLALSATTNINALELASISIAPTVDIVGTFTLASTTELKFGVITSPVVDKTVTVNSSGQVSGSATLLATGTLDGTPKSANTNTVSNGVLTVTGAVATLLENEGANHVSIVFPEEITLADEDSGTECGKITGLPTIPVTDAGTFPYGGTFTLTTTDVGLHCVADSNDATVTLMLYE